MRARVGVLGALLLAAAAPPAPPLALPGLAHWKYMALDAASHRLFIAGGDGVTAVDVAGWRVAGRLLGMRGARGVAIASDGTGYATDAKAARVVMFDAATLAPRGSIAAGGDAGAAAFDQASNQVYVLNDDEATISVIDAATHNAATTLRLPPGEGLQDAASDGHGTIYAVHSAARQLLRIAAPAARITARIPLAGCRKPEGVALDTAGGRIFVSCAEGSVRVLDAASFRALANLPAAADNQHLLFDAGRQRLYVPGDDSMVSVFSTAGRLRALPPLAGCPGARGGALDAATGRIFVVCSTKAPDSARLVALAPPE